LLARVASHVKKGLGVNNNNGTMGHLDSITNRQRKSRARDLLFVGFVALAATIGFTSFTTACQAAPLAHVVHK
jgi:hypothetical protein